MPLLNLPGIHFNTKKRKYPRKIQWWLSTKLWNTALQFLSLKKKLTEQQNTYLKLVSELVLATITKIQNQKTFMDGELLKNCFLSAAELIFGNFKNRIDIITNIKELQLSRRAIAKRVELLGENINKKFILYI